MNATKTIVAHMTFVAGAAFARRRPVTTNNGVLGRERMTVIAMSFLSMMRSDAVSAQYIFTLGHRLAMPGVYAMFDSTKMVENLARRDRPSELFKKDPMRARRVKSVNAGIPMRACAKPQPAF